MIMSPKFSEVNLTLNLKKSSETSSNPYLLVQQLSANSDVSLAFLDKSMKLCMNCHDATKSHPTDTVRSCHPSKPAENEVIDMFPKYSDTHHSVSNVRGTHMPHTRHLWWFFIGYLTTQGSHHHATGDYATLERIDSLFSNIYRLLLREQDISHNFRCFSRFLR